MPSFHSVGGPKQHHLTRNCGVGVKAGLVPFGNCITTTKPEHSSAQRTAAMTCITC